MSQVIKAYLAVFLILLLTTTALGFLSTYLQVLAAQDLQEQIVDEIENSAYAPGIVQGCFAAAGAAGCELAITYYDNGGGTVRCTDASRIPTDVSDISMARVELRFPLEIRNFGFRKMHTFTGDAR